MFTRATVFLAMLLIIAVPAGARLVAAEPLPEGQRSPAAEPTRGPGELCDLGNTGYYWSINGWFTGNESYMVYCDPSSCRDCLGGWKPVSMTMYLYWEDENTCALTVSAAVTAANMANPSCPVPGAAAILADPIVVGPLSPAGLWAVTVPFPEDIPALREPFFATITFHDSCSALPALITSTGPCAPCGSWNDWGTGLQRLSDFGFPGNLSVFATLECQGPSAVEETSWTTIKAKYRSGE
jgi:hypothetical protein